MKKMMLNLAGIMLLVGFMSLATVSAKAENLASYGSNNIIETNVLSTLEEQDFDLVNNTGLVFVTLNVSPNDDNNWGPDLLGRDVLASGETVEFTFDPSKVTYWDLLLVDDDGSSHELHKVNLKEIKTIELYSKDGKVTSISY